MKTLEDITSIYPNIIISDIDIHQEIADILNITREDAKALNMYIYAHISQYNTQED